MQSTAQTSYASMLSGTLFALHILWTFSNLFERKFKRNKLLNWKLWKCHAFKKDSGKRYRIHALYIIIILYHRWPSKTTTYLVSTFYINCHRIYLYIHVKSTQLVIGCVMLVIFLKWGEKFTSQKQVAFQEYETGSVVQAKDW